MSPLVLAQTVQGATVPAWLSLGLAGLLMIAVALHADRTLRTPGDPVRRRIRLANAALMLLTLPLLAAGFSLVNPAVHPRAWAAIWVVALGLLVLNIVLAIADVINTLRMLKRARRALRQTLLSTAVRPRTLAEETPEP
jgi:uncharacterized membrane protein YbhN (UPF0104 family)